MTPNECHGARYLNEAGHSQEAIAEFLDVPYPEVNRHVVGECSCPELDEPRVIPAVDGDEHRNARKAAGLTQVELGQLVGATHATISQIERETVEARPARRLRILEWLDEQDNEN